MLKFKLVNITTLLIFIGFLVVYFFFSLPLYSFFLLGIIWLLVTISGSFFIQWNYHFKSLNSNPNVSENSVAITFDDGPNPEITPKVLQLLADYNVKATFFCVGKQIAAHPELFKKIIEQGHVVGHHTYSHNSKFGFYKTAQVLEEFKLTEKLVLDIANLKMHLYRPAFGVTNPRIKKAKNIMNLISIGWNLRSLDTTFRSADNVLKRITKKCSKGDVILLHDSSEKTVIVLEQLLLFLQQQQLKSVSIDSLFNIKPYA